MRFFLAACLLCASAIAQELPHPENPDVVGYPTVGQNFICFNNDGQVESLGECGGLAQPQDEGFARVNMGAWSGGSDSQINGCGGAAQDPVSAATCALTNTQFASCTGDQYVLIRNTKSPTYWALQANADCDLLSAIQACRQNDAFDPVTGCSPTTTPPVVTVDSGYLKLDSTVGAPPSSHCDEGSEVGRMVFDGVSNLLYVCLQSGWSSSSMALLP